jgi:hypothetical protein
MPQVVFADSLGGPFRNVFSEEIVTLLSIRGEEYWNSKNGSGSAQLFYCEDETQRDVSTEIALNITVNDEAGVYISHRGSDGRPHSACVGEMDKTKASLMCLFGVRPSQLTEVDHRGPLHGPQRDSIARNQNGGVAKGKMHAE